MEIFCLMNGLMNGCKDETPLASPPFSPKPVKFSVEWPIDHYLLEAEWAWVVATVRENSGTFLDLSLDATLKHNSSGYAVSIDLDYEKYFNDSRVKSCSYSKKVEADSKSIASIVLGVIGGIVSLSNLFGAATYGFLRKKILKKNTSLTNRMNENLILDKPK